MMAFVRNAGCRFTAEWRNGGEQLRLACVLEAMFETICGAQQFAPFTVTPIILAIDEMRGKSQ